ncbi:ufm1-specific protease-like [Gordionus sp. m RMFG-2023]|uniref:ufm1-specific protease-like n=1 Tax=Gordionus sp. m RMFG-2023 TaxID=3053472 RepID=UPI0031FDBD5D
MTHTQININISIIWNEDALFQWYLKDAINNWVEKLTNRTLYFSLFKTDNLKNDDKIYFSDTHHNINANYKYLQDIINSRQLSHYKNFNYIPIEVLMLNSGKKSINAVSHAVPVIKIEKVEGLNTHLPKSEKAYVNPNDYNFLGEMEEDKNLNRLIVIQIQLTTLYIGKVDESLTTLAAEIRSRLVGQLQTMRDSCMENNTNILFIKDAIKRKLNKNLGTYPNNGDEVMKLTLFNPLIFWPNTGVLNIPITLVYETFWDSAKKKNVRKECMKTFLIPLCRPLFVERNAIKNFSSEEVIYFLENHIINPHSYMKTIESKNKSKEKIKAIKELSNTAVAQKKFVRGNYAYYHYGQNKVNDNGWGCAYRSLQTISSWLILQGYTEAIEFNAKLDPSLIDRPPTLLEIQKALHEIGDKDKAFVGSCQWIGSNEVSYVLQHFYQIDSRILHLRSGLEMKDYLNTFLFHFETQGTPIMIGGGALAHTIIGISYEYEKDEIKYLILDPHYIGPDDIDSILKEGGCYWKGSKFWETSKFYNLCLPQRPLIY